MCRQNRERDTVKGIDPFCSLIFTTKGVKLTFKETIFVSRCSIKITYPCICMFAGAIIMPRYLNQRNKLNKHEHWKMYVSYNTKWENVSEL